MANSAMTGSLSKRSKRKQRGQILLDLSILLNELYRVRYGESHKKSWSPWRIIKPYIRILFDKISPTDLTNSQLLDLKKLVKGLIKEELERRGLPLYKKHD